MSKCVFLTCTLFAIILVQYETGAAQIKKRSHYSDVYPYDLVPDGPWDAYPQPPNPYPYPYPYPNNYPNPYPQPYYPPPQPDVVHVPGGSTTIHIGPAEIEKWDPAPPPNEVYLPTPPPEYIYEDN